MEKRINEFAVVLCIFATVLLAGTLAWNGIEALCGKARFASWHLFTLTGMTFFTLTYLEETPELKARLLELMKTTRKKAARHSRTVLRLIGRAVAASALFLFGPGRPRTEP